MVVAMENLIKIELYNRFVGPFEDGMGILLGNKDKIFSIMIGRDEAEALIRALSQKKFHLRPLTHDLINNIFNGFNIKIKNVIISSIDEKGAFCTTLILEQNDEWLKKRNEVKLDSRTSDGIILAVMNKVPIYINKDLFESDLLDDVKDEIDLKLDDKKDKILIKEKEKSYLDKLLDGIEKEGEQEKEEKTEETP